MSALYIDGGRESTPASRNHLFHYWQYSSIRNVRCARRSIYIGRKTIFDSKSLWSKPITAEQQDLPTVKFKLKGVKNSHFTPIVFTN